MKKPTSQSAYRKLKKEKEKDLDVLVFYQEETERILESTQQKHQRSHRKKELNAKSENADFNCHYRSVAESTRKKLTNHIDTVDEYCFTNFDCSDSPNKHKRKRKNKNRKLPDVKTRQCHIVKFRNFR